MSKKGENNINKLLGQFTKITYRLALCDIDGRLMARSSGFLYQPDPTKYPFVVTAGHDTPVKGVAIETDIIIDGEKKLALNAGEFQVFYSGQHGDYDYAYSVLPLDLIQKDLKKIGFNLDVYRGKFVKAQKGEPYGFAVLNDYEFVPTSSGYGQQRFLCSEVNLELLNQDEHFNYFKLSRPFPEDDYYPGASGAPIFDIEGAITSILIGGADDKSYLKAFRLDNIEFTYPG